ncbi:MAG: UDP-3-O-(3-hydroxymyristoyl)glucosamine N-acyltransferase [Rhizobiaceae bacterium]|nr:UDP-3-O-(3-hydroxymyristoyl)glucosamine N-acyltransferase [Rhizobiaceae bacterium]
MTDPVFFAPARRFTVAEIAAVTGATIVDPKHESVEISSVATATEGREGSLIFIENNRFASVLASTRAAAVLCKPEIVERVPDRTAALVIDKPQRGFAAAARVLFPSAVRPQALTGETGISSAAHIGDDATIEDGAIVEAGAVIGPRAAIGAGTLIAPGAVIGSDCRVGRDSYVGPNATVVCAMIGDRVIVHAGVRIGQDGYGYAAGDSGPEKIPQLGRVVIQDDVEIGANTTIDRGAINDTIIGLGTKIDNLVQIGHNVRIGRYCLIAGHAGISGSVTLADYVTIGGGTGLKDHLTVGTGAQIGGGSGVMSNVPPGAKWAGYPARPYREFLREMTTLRDVNISMRKGGKPNE